MNYKAVVRPERTVIVRNKNKQYVYLTQKVQYSPELKRSSPKRILIGKLDEQGMLIPNKNYFDLFGETVELEL